MDSYDLYCVPCPDILEAMGLEPGKVAKIKRGCYGLVDAPLEWRKTVSQFLQSEGLVKPWSDPCCWLYKKNGITKGMIAGHVGDFLFTGDSQDQGWCDLERKIKERFKWGDWDADNFVQCGVKVERQPDGSFHLSQQQYLDKVSEINLNASRRKQPKEQMNEWEKTQLRGLLGALSWYSQMCSTLVCSSRVNAVGSRGRLC